MTKIRVLDRLLHSFRNRFGSGRSKSDVTVPDQFRVDLEQAVHDLENRKYAEALKKVDTVLSQDRGIPVAVYLKARIVWEGFRYSPAAKQSLKQVIELVPDPDHLLHRMAAELLSRIDKPYQVVD